MKPIFSLAFVVSVLCFVSSASAGTTLYVSPDGTNDSAHKFPDWAGASTSINAAVNATANGDVVYVTNATYYTTNIVVVTNNVTLISTNGSGDGATAVINAHSAFVGIRVWGGCVAIGFTISNGNYAHSSSSKGGGAAVYGTLRDCVVASSVADWGGGVNLLGGVLERCTIRGNTTRNDNLGTGGGIWGYGTIRNCLITGNSCEQAATGGGGGGYIWGSASVVENCSFISNICVGGYGGGAYILGSTIRNCLIAGNRSTSHAGGLYVTNVTAVQNCTIARNSAGANGGGMYYRTGTTVGTVTNSIIYDNTAVSGSKNIYGADDALFGYCCTTGLTHGVNGNITNVPQFVDSGSGYGTSATLGTYRLTPSSPCVNAGTNQDWMSDATDLAGNRRIDSVGKRVDIGAYEFLARLTTFIFR